MHALLKALQTTLRFEQEMSARFEVRDMRQDLLEMSESSPRETANRKQLKAGTCVRVDHYLWFRHKAGYYSILSVFYFKSS